jgi:chemotaxis protein CheY-P-specific phosphatase CheC
MPEEKKGHMKITIEVEVNEMLIDTVKEAISQMSSALPAMMKHRKEEKEKE